MCRVCKCRFSKLLSKDNSLTIHHSNLQKLGNEVFKVKNGVTPVIMSNVFDIVHSSYNFRNKTKFRTKIFTQANMVLKQDPVLDQKYGTFSQMNAKC